MIRSWSEGFLPGIKLQSAASLNGSTAATVPNPRTQLLTPDHNVWLSLPASFETGSYKVSRRRAGVKTMTREGNKRRISVAGRRLPPCSGNPVLDSAADTLHWALGAHGCTPAASCERCCVKATVTDSLNRKPALQNKAWKIDTELQLWLYSGTADAV